MVFKQIDELGKQSIYLTGRILAKSGKSAVNSLVVGETPKVYFNVCAESMKTAKGEIKYINFLCACYCRQWNIGLYQLCTTLTHHEVVEISGVLVKKSGFDRDSGEERIFEEVQIETLVPMSRMCRLLLKMDGTDEDKLRLADIIKQTPKGTGKGYVPDDDFPF